eukprot:2210018-Amphidinium_carterae.1
MTSPEVLLMKIVTTDTINEENMMVTVKGGLTKRGKRTVRKTLKEFSQLVTAADGGNHFTRGGEEHLGRSRNCQQSCPNEQRGYSQGLAAPDLRENPPVYDSSKKKPPKSRSKGAPFLKSIQS